METRREENMIALSAILSVLNKAYHKLDALSDEQHEQLWKPLNDLNNSFGPLWRRLKSFEGYTTFKVACSNDIHDYMQKSFKTLDEAEAFYEQEKDNWKEVCITMSKIEDIREVYKKNC